MRVLILGVSGMLGNAVFRVLSEAPQFQVFGSARSEAARRHFPEQMRAQILCGVDVENQDALTRLFGAALPDVVINCVGLVKQLADVDDPMYTIPINALLPHRLSALCKVAGARLVHISTDCVFSGDKGGYVETDFPDADDLYGRSKLLGEVDAPHAFTVRTSIIGHELAGNRSLINWFLSQQETARGYSRAIFSGLPTVVLAGIIRDVIIPRPDLHGVYHVAAAPISKLDLLQLVADVYGKDIALIPDENLVIDRALDAGRFRSATGYTAPTWRELIETMHAHK